ncbi:TPA: hypothetical protein DEP21_03915 [Patescibacteria group bacterium]|nr:hypothetical protein [Candidatus Gracilibacteria bacterium]
MSATSNQLLIIAGHQILSGSVQIQFTVAVDEPVIPIVFINWNVKLQFPLNVYWFDQELFVIVMGSEYQVSVAVTVPE